MSLAVLSIDLEARLVGLQEGFEKAARLADKNASMIEARWAAAGATMARIGALVAGGAVGAAAVGVFAFVKSNAEAIDALNDVADSTGASIENISALEDLAKRTGTTLDTVTGILVKFNGVLADAKADSPTARALQAIGLEAERLRALDPAEALRQVAVALTAYADDGNKARLVQDLFGKSVREAAPFLKDLAEQSSLVAKATSAEALEAEKFNKQLFQLQANILTVSRDITGDLLPALNGIFESVKRNGGFWAAFADGFGTKLDMDEAITRAGELRNAMRQLEAGLAIPENQRTGVQKARIQELREEVAELMREAAAASDALKRRANGGELPQPKTAQQAWEAARAADIAGYSRLSVDMPGGTKPGAGTGATARQAAQISEAQRALAAYVDELQREIDKTVELTEQQKALLKLKELKELGELPQVRELVLGQAQRVDGLRQQEEIEKGITAELERQAAARRELDDLLDRLSGRTEDARKRALTGRLEEQLNAGVQYSPEELDNIVRGIGGVSLELAEPVKEQLKQMDELTKQFARNTQDALGDTLKRTLKGDFDDIGDLWGNLLLDMVTQAAAVQFGKSLFGDLFSGGDLGGLAATALTFLGIPGFATGGDHMGGWRIVGENGPELEATGAARIYNTQQTQQILGKGGGGVGAGRQLALTYAPVYQIDSRSDRAAVMADAHAMDQRSQADLIKLLKAKGVI